MATGLRETLVGDEVESSWEDVSYPTVGRPIIAKGWSHPGINMVVFDARRRQKL